MYKSLVRSHLDYCDVIFHNPPVMSPTFTLSLPDLMETLERVQYRAGLAVTGCWKGTSRVKLYEELGWESLSDRRMSRRILQLHKIIDEKTPQYLRDKLPPNRNVLVNLPYVFSDMRCRTDRYCNSFFPNGASTWNNVISHFDTFPSFLKLKSHLLSLFRPNFKSVFNVHNPPLLRYLFQLRVGLSKLRAHKKRHNFIDTPTDLCLCKNGVEDTHHFLLVCPFYNAHRKILIANIDKIFQENDLNSAKNVKLLLYGHEKLPCKKNAKIISHVLEFIKNSNRLST